MLGSTEPAKNSIISAIVDTIVNNIFVMYSDSSGLAKHVLQGIVTGDVMTYDGEQIMVYSGPSLYFSSSNTYYLVPAK